MLPPPLASSYVFCSFRLTTYRGLRGLSNYSCGTVVTLLLSEEDFGNLVEGKGNAQRLFMSGKLKVKGDIMKATKLEPILKKAKSKANL